MTGRWLLCALTIVAMPARAQGVPLPPPQYPPGGAPYPIGVDTGQRRPRSGLPRNPADSARADSLKAPRILVEWPEPDSVMAALLSREGYTTTRYQGNNAQLNSRDHELTLSV